MQALRPGTPQPMHPMQLLVASQLAGLALVCQTMPTDAGQLDAPPVENIDGEVSDAPAARKLCSRKNHAWTVSLAFFCSQPAV